MAEQGALIKIKEQINRYPYSLSFDAYPAKLMNLGIDEYLLNPLRAFEACLYANEYFQVDTACSYFIPGAICKDFGGEIRFSSAEWPLISKRPIENIHDIDALNPPDPRQSFSFAQNSQFLNLCVQHGFGHGFYVSSLLERIVHLAGVELVLKWMIKQPQAVHYLLELVLAYTVREIELYLDTFGRKGFGISFAYSFESQPLLSPKQFEVFCAPYILRLHQELYRLGVRSFSESLCGCHDQTLSFWCRELAPPPGTVFTLDHLTDFDRAESLLGDDYPVAGNLSTILLNEGTPQQVYDTTRGLIAKYHQRPGGFIVAPDSGIPFHTPEQNIFAFLAAAADAAKE